MAQEGMKNVFRWQGPGYYGPVQVGTGESEHIEMVFVTRHFYDGETLEKDKKAAGVMTAVYFAEKPDDAE